MDATYEVWRRIEVSRRRHTPTLWPHLRPGATEEQIKQLEGILGVTLPEDFRASYRLHGGGFAVELATPMEALPLEDIAENWQILTELLKDDEWAQQPPYYFSEDVARSGWQAGPIRPVWWDRRWIPFASDRAGNLSCLDLAPVPGGSVGQIIDWDHECGPSRVLFSSFQQLLDALADQLERTTGEVAE